MKPTNRANQSSQSHDLHKPTPNFEFSELRTETPSMRQQRRETITGTTAHPLAGLRAWRGRSARRIARAAKVTQLAANHLVRVGKTQTSNAPRALAGAVQNTKEFARSKRRQLAQSPRKALILFLCACLLVQPNAAFASNRSEAAPPRLPLLSAVPETPKPNHATPTSEPRSSLQNYLEKLGDFISLNAALLPPVPPITDAAVSRHKPALNAGRIEGSLRVFSGETYAINTPFQLTGDLYAVGNPQIIVGGGASHGGLLDDGGSATPSNYSITLNGGLVLPGKIHRRADALALPTDIPTTVPTPTATRTVNINTPADVATIGAWNTVRDLNVTPANLVINVPPGNYRTFSINAATRLNFTAGTYNFSGTINLNGGASIQTTGRVDINIGQAFNLNQGSIIPGANTLPGDVHVNAISTGGCTLNGSSLVTGLIRCPNSTFTLNGTYPIVTGQVIANYLSINTGKITGNASVTPPPDTTLPVVAITSPQNNSTTISSSITVSGTASDPGTSPSGIAQVTVNNVPATFNAANGTWTISNVALAPGSNTLTARATDNAGNLASPQSITVIRQTDTTAPTVAITSPGNNSTTEADTITVSGTMSDTGAGASGVAQVMVNGVPALLNVPAGTWSLTNFPVGLGNNSIAAIAKDNAGNESAPHSIVVVRQNPQDTTPPTVAITAPGNNSTTQSESITVSGITSDAGPNASGVASVSVDGAPANFNAQAGTWTISVSIAIGPKTITAIAKDHAGNDSTPHSITVTRETPPDTAAPIVSITSPENGLTTEAETVTVSGNVSDPGQYASGVASVTVNDQPASVDLQAGTWTLANFSLNVGNNPITVVAKDAAGNSSPPQSISVTRQTPPDQTGPTLIVTEPTDGSHTQSETIVVSGSVADLGQYPSGVAQVTVNDVPATINSDCTWTLANVPLPIIGSNAIVVIAKDQAGNATTKPLTIFRDVPPDILAPTVAITSPLNNFTSPDATITVTGTAMDDGAYATGVRRVVVNGQEASYDPLTHQWTAIGISLNEGPNVIQAYAEDGATPPNRGEASAVNGTLHTPDTKAPVVTITSPVAAFDTYDATLSLAGGAVDDGLNFTGVQSVTVNGLPANYNASTSQWSLAAFPLAYGDNHILVVARDGAPTPNQGQAFVDVRRLRIPPPTLEISNPQNGGVLAATSITVAGSVSSMGSVTVTVNGENAPVSGGQFTKTVTLAEGPNSITVVAKDSIDQETQSSLSVIRDMSPPAVSFANVPASVQPGSSYQILVDAADNVGVADVEFRVNGQHVATNTTAPYQFTLTLPLAYAADTTLVLSAVARDLTNTTAVATAQTRTGGPGGISGYVFDDATGYVLPAVNVALNNAAAAPTDAQGVFNLVSATPSGVVRLSKDGYTAVERLYSVSTGEGTALFDTRLTPLDTHANSIGVAGGTASGDGGRLQATFDAGTFSDATDVRVTSVSPQGLQNLLPYGWSPVPGAVVDVRAANGAAPAHLVISQVANLTSATPLTLARYDESGHRWVVVATNLFATANGGLSADLPSAGQFAFLVADTGAIAPPPPVVGQALTAAQPADSAALDSAQATAVATPRTAAFSASALSSISFVATAPAQLPSGVSIEATFGETYNLLGGRDSLLVDRPAQDFVLYAFPAATNAQPNRLGAFFVAKPTRTDFTITEIFNANVHVEIRSGRQTKLGILIDDRGGALRASDGSQLTIPANSVSGSHSVFFNDVAPQYANVTLPEGYEIVAAFDVDLASASLTNSATITVPGLTGDLSRIVVARLLTVGGQRSPKVVARATTDSSGSLSSTTATPPVPSGVSLTGVRTSGRYLFIRMPNAFGYVKGIVTESSSGGNLGMVKVSGNQTPFIDVTGTDGQYVLIGSAGADAAGTNQIGAAALTTDATGRATASLAAQDAVGTANISVSALPLEVESITPAANAQSMIATTPVTITFNKPIAASSVTGSSLSVSTLSGNPVLGNITVLAGSRVVVFTPAQTLAASTTYKVVLSQSVRDIYGHQLAAAFNSTFSTAATVTVSSRLRPEQIVISYPDANGMSSISLPAGSVPEGSSILVVNNTSGSTLSTVAGTTALLLQIQARVGDELTLTISQPDGTQYRVTQAAYRRADGFISVGANGGTVTSDDGRIQLSIPVGAISGQADLKLTSLAETDINIPRQGEMDPENVVFGAGVRITAAGNFTNDKELHLEVAAPPTAVEGARVVFMKPAKLTEANVQRDVWEVVTSGKTEGGKFKTMSPPFLGVILGQILGNPAVGDYYTFFPRRFRAVTGMITEHVNNGAAKPLENVLVTISGNNATVTARTAANGRFGTLDFAVASADSVEVSATDSLGRTKTAGATPYLNFSQIDNPGLTGLVTMYAAIEFPSSDGLPETLPALLRMEGRLLDLDSGQPDTLQSVGRVLVHSHLEVKTVATPDVQQITGQLLVGGTTQRQLVWTRLGSGAYVTDFTVDAEGSYSVAVTTYTQANVQATKATATFGFVALQDPNVRPSLDGPPRVLSITPANGSQQVQSGSRIHLEFSEPVKNLVPGQTLYLKKIGTEERIGGDLSSGGLPIGANQERISSIDLQPAQSLEADKEYEVVVTTSVLDSTDKALDQEYTSPDDNSPQPFRSTFKTFHSFVLTETPPETDSYRIAAAGDVAITVTPDFGSFMHVWDMSDPSTPKLAANQFVANYAIAFDIAEAETDEDIIKVDSPQFQRYSTIAVVISTSPRDTSRPINLWIYSLDDPYRPKMIGVVSLNIPDSLPAYPSYVKIHHTRAYIGSTGRGGVAVVDLQNAVTQLAGDNQYAWFRAVLSGGYGNENKRQKATYGHSEAEAAPVFAVSVMDQNVPAANGGGASKSPVAYIASNKLQLFSFDFNKSQDDVGTVFRDNNGDGNDDHLLASANLNPQGLAVDVRAVPDVNLHGQATDLAVLLGYDRLWIFDVTNPRTPQPFTSRSFADMGLGTDYAKRFEVEGTFAYVMFNDKVAVIDFGNPALPFVSSTITELGTDLRWLAVQDGFIYTLDAVGTTRTARMRVSIGGAAALVYAHGRNTNDPLGVCANPVLVSRTDNRMMQDAEVIFTVYGHDAPLSKKVIITKELVSGDQTIRENLATIDPTLDSNTPTNIVKGRARWPWTAPINRAALYYAQLIIDEGLPTEFRARRVEIPFSNLIDHYQEEWGVPQNGGIGYLPYLLGGNAHINLMLQGSDSVFHHIQLDTETTLRPYGFNTEKVMRSLPGLNGLPAGRYLFRLQATASDTDGVSETVEGNVTIGEAPRAVRQPGAIVVGSVELESGNLGLSHTDIPEIKNRGLSLSFVRYYNSAGADAFNPFGYGWHHNYQVLLVRHDQGDPGNPNVPPGPFYEIVGGEGSGAQFEKGRVSVGVEAAARAPFQGTLRKNADDTFDFFTKSHVMYHFNQDIEATNAGYFNLGYMGNLAYIEEPNGNRIKLSYDGQGRLFSVADSSDRKLEFTYEQAVTPFVGTVDNGSMNGQATNCTSRRFMRSLRQRFLQAQIGRAWHIIKVTGPGGIEINYDYDGEGNLLRATKSGSDDISQATGDSIWQYAYNPTAGQNANPNYNHLIRSVKSPNQSPAEDRLTRYEYELDKPGNPVKTIKMPEQVSNEYSYTFTNGKITAATVTDGRGNSTGYQFVNTGDTKTVTINAPRDAQSVVVFDNYGNRTSETDPEGTTTVHRYENGNAVETITTGGGLTTRTTATYDQTFNKMTSFTDAKQQTTSYSLDGDGNTTRIQLPTGRSIILDFKGNGDLERKTDQYGFTTTYESYDAYGNVTTIRRQTSGGSSVLGHQTFDVRSRLLTSSDDLGPTVSNAYDALDRVVQQTVTDPSGFRDTLNSTMTYLLEGQLKKLTQSGGNQQTEVVNEYDALNRIVLTTETISGAGTFVQPFRYDKNSNLEEETDRRGVKRTRTFDALNFIVSETLSGSYGPSLAIMTAEEVDKIGNPKRVRNLFNQVVSLDYDGLHRLKTRHLPGGYSESFDYDDNGQVILSRDRNGRETTFEYDPVTRPKLMRDPASRITTWTYDDATRTVTTQHAPQGLTEVVREDGLGRELRRELSFGSSSYVTTNAYQGRQVTTTDPRGTVSVRQVSAFNESGSFTVNGANPAYSMTLHYAALGGVTSQTDALNRETTYTVDGLGRATQINHPGGVTERFVYDGEGLMLSHTDRRSAVSTMTYDNLQRQLTTRVQDGAQQIAVLTTQYDDVTRTETHTDAEGHPSVYVFDGLGRPSSLKNADNKTKSWSYDGMNLRKESDFKGVFTEFEYDGVDRLTLVKDRKGQVTNIVNADSNGYTRTTTDRRGKVLTETFDPLGRLKKTVHGGEPLATYEYDGNNNRISVIDGLDNPTIYTYDKLNRVTSINHANLQTETFSYDAVGNVLTHSDGRGPGDTFEYDALDHLKKRVDGESNLTQFRYDGEGLLLEKTDPKGANYKTTYVYNALRSLKQVRDAAGGVWQFEYDGVQNLRSVKDALDRTVGYDYDALNRLRQVNQPQSLVTIFGYDANNNRNSITDPKGQLTTITFDELDRPSNIAYTNTNGSQPVGYIFGFDPENNLTNVTEKLTPSNSRNYARSYDSRNRLLSTTDPYNHIVAFTYDAANNVKSVKDAALKETSYSYDALNRLQNVTMTGGATAAYSWFADGLLKTVDYGSGLKREYSYDNADRLTQLTNTVGTGSGVKTQQFVYGYDGNSNRESETRKQNGETIRSITYGYDLLDRLTAASYTTPGQRPADPPAGESVSYTEMLRATGFAYDPVGNRTSASSQDHTTTITLTTNNEGHTSESRQTVDGPTVASTSQFDQLNRLTSMDTTGDPAGPITYAYDNNGNLTSTKQSNQVTASYEYDCRDQLRRVLNGSSQEVAAYDYDFERRRLGKTVGGSELRYVYAGDQVVNEYNASNVLQNRYDIGADEIVRAELGGGEGTRRYFSDALGSVTALSQQENASSSSLSAAFEYDAWGKYFSTAGVTSNTVGYTGQRLDAETGLMPLGNGERYYSAATGSFIQQDSFSGQPNVPLSLNRYSYVHDNPVNHDDPSGHFPPAILLIAFLAIIAADVAVQDYQIRTGTRAQTDFSLAEAGTVAAMQMPVLSTLGSAHNAYYGVDLVTGEQLSGKQRVFEGAMTLIDLLPVAGAVARGLRPATAVAKGSRAVAALEEGVSAVKTTQRAVSTAADEVRAMRGTVNALEEARGLRSGISKAEQAAAETIENAARKEAVSASKGSAELSSRGYRPAAGERSMGRAEWTAANRAERAASTSGTSWSKGRSDAWKQIAQRELEAPTGRYSAENLARMLKGRAARIRAEVFVRKLNRNVIKDISLELHHRAIPQRAGSRIANELWNLERATPWAHEAMDPYRHTGSELIRIIRGPNSF